MTSILFVDVIGPYVLNALAMLLSGQRARKVDGRWLHHPGIRDSRRNRAGSQSTFLDSFRSGNLCSPIRPFTDPNAPRKSHLLLTPTGCLIIPCSVRLSVLWFYIRGGCVRVSCFSRAFCRTAIEQIKRWYGVVHSIIVCNSDRSCFSFAVHM